MDGMVLGRVWGIGVSGARQIGCMVTARSKRRLKAVCGSHILLWIQCRTRLLAAWFRYDFDLALLPLTSPNTRQQSPEHVCRCCWIAGCLLAP